MHRRSPRHRRRPQPHAQRPAPTLGAACGRRSATRSVAASSIGSDEEDALDEARELDRELRSTVAATVYNVATYVSFRQLDGDETAFAERLKSDRPRLSIAHRRPRAARRVS